MVLNLDFYLVQPHKKLFNSAIQELYITNRKLENVNTRILENIKSIIIFYKSKINQKIAD